MKKREVKTPEYVSRAIKKYNEKFDIFTLKLPAGSRERMEALGMTPADRVQALLNEIERRERLKDSK